jgi:hypothetical protein
MNIEKVLTSFESLAKTLHDVKDVSMHRQMLTLLDVYPFPKLSRSHEWRKTQIRSAVEQRIALLETQANSEAHVFVE